MKRYTKFVCQQCGYESVSWLGKCPNCGVWNSLVETVVKEAAARPGRATAGEAKVELQKLSEIKSLRQERVKTEIEELDRVLGGGIVPGSLILLAGDPGIGKSTLLLQLAAKLGGVYVLGEESPQQVKLRAERLKISTKDRSDSLLLLAQTDVDIICTQIEESRPLLVVIDSIQTLTTSDLTGTAGSVGQVRESAVRLARIGKKQQIPFFLIGHVTKEGAIAGPMVLEHLVDTILFLEGERFYPGRDNISRVSV